MKREQCQWAAEADSMPSRSMATRREIPDMRSSLHCFSCLHCFSRLYAAIVCSKYPHKAIEWWAYKEMMVAEHHRCGGMGWFLYDSAFRQQITSLEEDISQLTRHYIPQRFWPMVARVSSARGVLGQTTRRMNASCSPMHVCQWCSLRTNQGEQEGGLLSAL